MSRSKDDCLRQCVAKVTGRPIKKVPHFVKRSPRGRWVWDLLRWGDRVGYNIVLSPNGRKRPSANNLDGYIELGPTRSKGTYHAVVRYLNGQEKFDLGNPIKRTEWCIFVYPRKGRK